MTQYCSIDVRCQLGLCHVVSYTYAGKLCCISNCLALSVTTQLLSKALVTLRQQSRPCQCLPLRNMKMAVMKQTQQGKWRKVYLFGYTLYHCFVLVSHWNLVYSTVQPHFLSAPAVQPAQDTGVVHMVAFRSLRLKCSSKCESASSRRPWSI